MEEDEEDLLPSVDTRRMMMIDSRSNKDLWFPTLEKRPLLIWFYRRMFSYTFKYDVPKCHLIILRREAKFYTEPEQRNIT